jgi:prepilin-type N-terminal cleavage/methylation domain-containing protein
MRFRTGTTRDAEAAPSGFSLIELLVVVGIIAVLLGVLMPALRKARMASRQTVCASNLRQVGAAIAIYVGENGQRLPLVVEPLWRPGGGYDFDADPTDPMVTPQSFHVVMRRYLSNMKVLLCPAAGVGYPRSEPAVSYRMSAANNADGQVMFIEQLVLPSGAADYRYNLKYLNGRRYQLRHANEWSFPFQIVKGTGPYYLFRDLVPADSAGKPTPPHPNRQFNQLKLDFSVSLEKDPNFGLVSP